MPSQPTRRQGHRRRSRKGTIIGASAIATVIVTGGVVALATSAGAASLGAVYSRTSAWETGYTGQYVVTVSYPSGRQESRTVEVTEESADVTMEVRPGE